MVLTSSTSMADTVRRHSRSSCSLDAFSCAEGGGGGGEGVSASYKPPVGHGAYTPSPVNTGQHRARGTSSCPYYYCYSYSCP